MFEVEVRVDAAAPSADVRQVADALWEEGSALYVSEAPRRLIVGFAERDTAEEAAARLGGSVVDVEAAGRGDLDAWRAWARPTRVGRLVVRPAWLPPERADGDGSGTGPAPDVEIAVDPGHSFGHGGHPSTRLVLAALVERLTGGESVLDVGCGSGVLSVAAVALGAESARAVDIDPSAVAVTRANALTNDVSHRIDVDSVPAAAIRRRFDVVVANIGVVVLRELAAALVARVAPGGWIAFSGLLEHQWEEVVARALDGAGSAGADLPAGPVRLAEVRREEGWAAPILTVGRPSQPASDGTSAPGTDPTVDRG